MKTMPAQPQMAQTPDRDDQDSLLVDLAWRNIHEDIVSGRLAPGTRLRIAKLRELYGVGASPLREALSRLSADGFVQSIERRGFMVAPVSLAEFRDLTNVRKLLEFEALRLSLRHGDEAWEAQLAAVFYRLGKAQERLKADDPTMLVQWEAVNRDFHEVLVSACNSPWTLQLRRTVYSFAERYRRICQTEYSVSRDVHEEHAQIMDAALKRDVDRICALIDEHLERTYQKVAKSGRV
ncbi:MAG TPA: FCD domain-containing protein [Nitrospira sp.]|uniref:GntR family transcriptional regulator n=1 Tax=Sphingobium sp. TaxID=1912891 RepID=UPI002ED673F7